MYGLLWPNFIDPVEREFECIRHGGRWKSSKNKTVGAGLMHHWKTAQNILWPHKKWHRWAELELRNFLTHRYIAAMGCAAAGKSFEAAANVLIYWYCWPTETTVIVSSTELEALEMRAWGMIKQLHKAAKEYSEFIPGHLIESRRRIVYDDKTEAVEGRDFRNGLVGVPCKRGQTFVGLGPLVGIHNKRVVLLADELSLMPRALIDSVSNLSKCPCFKLLGLGNPKDTTDALGVLAEPAAHLGGWEGGIDQTPGTKTWETKFPKGIAIQLPASDTPNNDGEPGKPPPFPFLVTREQVEEDVKIWGRDSLHFTMMSEAKMPRGQSAHRIITRNACLKFHAMEEPAWKDNRRTRIAGLDAAYRGVGGDRCVFCEFQFGERAEDKSPAQLAGQFVSQPTETPKNKIIIALIDILIVPVNVSNVMDLPEDQIANFVKAECQKRAIPPENFFFDSTGRGSLMSAFARLWSAHVVGIEFGGKASEQNVSNEINVKACDYYFNRVTELWHSMRLVIEAEQMRGLTEEVVKELSYREWKHVGGHNKIQAETKEEMKQKAGRSPDLADCACIALEGARQRGFIIARSTASGTRRQQSQWKREVAEVARASWANRNLDYKV